MDQKFGVGAIFEKMYEMFDIKNHEILKYIWSACK